MTASERLTMAKWDKARTELGNLRRGQSEAAKVYYKVEQKLTRIERMLHIVDAEFREQNKIKKRIMARVDYHINLSKMRAFQASVEEAAGAPLEPGPAKKTRRNAKSAP